MSNEVSIQPNMVIVAMDDKRSPGRVLRRPQVYREPMAATIDHAELVREIRDLFGEMNTVVPQVGLFRSAQPSRSARRKRQWRLQKG